MKPNEIYRSEGGYRVAAELCNGGPILKSSPWFPNKGLATAWRKRAVENDWDYLYDKDYIYYRGKFEEVEE